MKATIIITAFDEPNIGKAIEAAQRQIILNTGCELDILVSAPDDKTLNEAENYCDWDSRVKIFQDEGKGKSAAINEILKIVNSDILIFTDGDVTINKWAVKHIMKAFENPEVGCVTGRPIPMENKKIKYGYWANFLFDAAHDLRHQANWDREFIECSGYLFAFRNGFIPKIPLNVAEDTIIPYMFHEKGYRIAYVEEARVHVKNVDNWKDWIKQKIRTAKAHSNIGNYVDVRKTKKVKSFWTEAKGITRLFTYPSNIKEFWWTIELIFARLYLWTKVFIDEKFRKKTYSDGWERSESTKCE